MLKRIKKERTKELEVLFITIFSSLIWNSSVKCKNPTPTKLMNQLKYELADANLSVEEYAWLIGKLYLTITTNK